MGVINMIIMTITMTTKIVCLLSMTNDELIVVLPVSSAVLHRASGSALVDVPVYE